MNKILVLAGLALALTACSPSAENVSDGSFDGNKVAYFRDNRTGFCFSVVASSRLDSGGKLSYSVSHSNVPCSADVEKLLRKSN